MEQPIVQKSIRIQNRPLYRDCLAISHRSPVTCESWFQISSHSARYLSAAFDTIYHQMLFSTLCCWASHELHFADLKLTGRSFKVQSISSGHRGTSKAVLNSVYFFIYTILLGHFIQAHGFSYHVTPTCSYTHFNKAIPWYLGLPGRHLSKYEYTPPPTQPSKDETSCLPSHSKSTT